MIGRQQVGLVAYGAAQKQFNVSDAIEFVFPVPPEVEQSQIADFIAMNLTRFDALLVSAQDAVELLQERRAALHSSQPRSQARSTCVAGSLLPPPPSMNNDHIF